MAEMVISYEKLNNKYIPQKQQDIKANYLEGWVNIYRTNKITLAQWQNPEVMI